MFEEQAPSRIGLSPPSRTISSSLSSEPRKLQRARQIDGMHECYGGVDGTMLLLFSATEMPKCCSTVLQEEQGLTCARSLAPQSSFSEPVALVSTSYHADLKD